MWNEARRALSGFIELGTPWWVAETLRVPDRAGAASEAEGAQADSMDRALGIVGTVW